MEKYSLCLLRRMLIDFAVLAVLFGVMYLLRHADPFQRGLFCGDQSILYPYRTNTVSSDMLHAVGFLLPALMIVIVETATLYRSREECRRVFGVSVPSWVVGCYGVMVTFCVGLLCTELATNLSKVTIGRLRPCFVDVCKPSIDCSLPQNQNRYISPEEFHCTNTEYSANTMRDIRVSFMSGHSSWAAYTMIFLALYLHKRVSWRVTRLPTLVLQFTVVMLSFFTALSRVSDNKHHWSDVLFGYSTGALFAIIAVTWCMELTEKPQHKQVPQNERAVSVERVIINSNLSLEPQLQP